MLRRIKTMYIITFNIIALVLIITLCLLLRPLGVQELWIAPGHILSIDPFINASPLMQQGTHKRSTNLFMTYVKETEVKSYWQKVTLGFAGYVKRAELKSYSNDNSDSDFTERDLNVLGGKVIPYMKHDIIKAAMVYNQLEWTETVSGPIVIFHPEKFKTGLPLKDEDEILYIDNSQVESIEDINFILDGRRLGDTVDVTVTRDGQKLIVPVTLRDKDHKGNVTLGVYVRNRFTFIGLNNDDILHLKDDYSGESGGFMLALGLIQQLEPGKSFANGRVVAGTGGVTRSGYIVEIGNLDLKILTAKRDGADIFFYPKAQEAAATAAIEKYGVNDMKLVPVNMILEAVEYLLQDSK